MADLDLLEYRLQQAMLARLRATTTIVPKDMVTQLGEEGEPLIRQVTLGWDDFAELMIKAGVFG